MTKIKIEQPHGYLLDKDGKVILRFGNWDVGFRDISDRNIADYVDDVEYVNGPSDHERDVADDYQRNQF